MRSLIVGLLAVSAFAQSKPAATCDPKKEVCVPSDRIDLLDLATGFNKLAEKQRGVLSDIEQSELGKKRAKITEDLKAVNAQIDAGPLGKELGEVLKQMEDMQKQYTDKSTPILESNACKGGVIDPQTLLLKNCPVKP